MNVYASFCGRLITVSFMYQKTIYDIYIYIYTYIYIYIYIYICIKHPCIYHIWIIIYRIYIYIYIYIIWISSYKIYIWILLYSLFYIVVCFTHTHTHTHTPTHTHIYIYIYIILLRHQHGSPWSSPATILYRPLFLAVHAFASRVLMSLSVDETLLPRLVNLSTSFRELPFSVDMSPLGLKHLHSVLRALTWRPMPAVAGSRQRGRVTAWVSIFARSAMSSA